MVVSVNLTNRAQYQNPQFSRRRRQINRTACTHVNMFRRRSIRRGERATGKPTQHFFHSFPFLLYHLSSQGKAITVGKLSQKKSTVSTNTNTPHEQDRYYLTNVARFLSNHTTNRHEIVPDPVSAISIAWWRGILASAFRVIKNWKDKCQNVRTVVNVLRLNRWKKKLIKT